MKTIVFVSIFAVALALQPAQAQQKSEAVSPGASVGMTQGEVRKVDMAAKKITLKHGPIVNLDMPAMTMVFLVSDPKLLENLKVGDKVKFTASRAGDDYSVTRIEAAR